MRNTIKSKTSINKTTVKTRHTDVKSKSGNAKTTVKTRRTDVKSKPDNTKTTVKYKQTRVKSKVNNHETSDNCIALKKNAASILNAKLSLNDCVGEFDNWSHNVKLDFFGQAARNLQALIQKFATAVSCIVEKPIPKSKLSYTKGDLMYLCEQILGDKDFSKYSILHDKYDPQKRTTLNGEANTSKHKLTTIRSRGREWAEAYNDLVSRVQKKLKLKDISKFKVDVRYIKPNDAPTDNYNYMKPNEIIKRQNETNKMFKKILLVPDDYYIQLKAIKYQRDVILKENLDNKWDQIREDRSDHSAEIDYIMDSIGDHTYKIDCLIGNLIFNHINHKNAILIAKKYLQEEIDRNNKIIEYEMYLIDGVEQHGKSLIRSTGVLTKNTSILKEYIEKKKNKNIKLKEMMMEIDAI